MRIIMWLWKLAIKGHPTRGKEIIEFLEMLGGRNILNLGTNIKIEEDLLYTIRRDYHFGDVIEGVSYAEDTWILTDIEECLELYPFKVGDKVHIPEYESEVSICKAKWNPHPFCRHVEYLVYRNDEEVWYSAQELKECNADFLINKKCSEMVGEMSNNITLNNPDKEGEKKSLLTSLIEYFQTTPKDVLEREWNEHKELDEIGPTVEEYINFAESFKKQLKYPKTYKECCEVLDIESEWHLTFELNNFASCDLCINKEFEYVCKLEAFRKLLISRDAYWMIAGKEMGLEKSWEPDWLDTNTQKYCIYYVGNEIKKQPMLEVHHSLAFPTEEMRDTFYENFKDLIEECKELL